MSNLDQIARDILEIASWGLHDEANETVIDETQIIDDDFERSIEFSGETDDGTRFFGKLVLAVIDYE